ncbi:hypothetical protein OH77DRAFT_1432540 [Trametes cingulata]|nr:hypothetical protein OH77DRAFT_1432540 [Trametes cingulata]
MAAPCCTTASLSAIRVCANTFLGRRRTTLSTSTRQRASRHDVIPDDTPADTGTGSPACRMKRTRLRERRCACPPQSLTPPSRESPHGRLAPLIAVGPSQRNDSARQHPPRPVRSRSRARMFKADRG